jgi:HlyD family secretion protein
VSKILKEEQLFLGLADGINVEIISGLKKDEKVKVWSLTQPNKKEGNKWGKSK